MAKKKQKEVIVPINYMAFTSDDMYYLKRMVTMCETMVYHAYMSTFLGTIDKVVAYVDEVKNMNKLGIKEVDRYFDGVKAMGKKYFVNFDIQLTPKEETKVVDDEL